MSSFVPIDPTGLSDRELLERALRGIADVHQCVHQTEAAAIARDQAAVAALHRVSNEVTQLKGGLKKVVTSVASVAGELENFKDSVSDLAGEIGGVKTSQAIDSGRISKLTKMFGAEPWAHGEKKTAPQGVVWWNWRKATIAGIFVVLAALVANAATYGLVRKLLVTTDTYLVELAKKK